MINGTSFRTAGLTAAPLFAKALRRLAPIMGLRPDLPPAQADAALYTLVVND